MAESARSVVGAVTERLLDTLDVKEVQGEGGGPLQTFVAQMDPVAGDVIGDLRLYRGEVTVVTTSMASPLLGLDTHQVTVFTAPDSVVPHLTVDAALAPTQNGEHHVGADLLGRVDLPANPGYLDVVYRPLSSALDAATADERLRPATGLDPVRKALRSPWLFAAYLDEPDLPAAMPVTDAYVDHWLALFRDGVADYEPDLDAAALADRDRRFRATLFALETNPLWGLVDRLLGASSGAAIRDVLATA